MTDVTWPLPFVVWTEKAAVLGPMSRLVVVENEFGAPVGETLGWVAALVSGDTTSCSRSPVAEDARV